VHESNLLTVGLRFTRTNNYTIQFKLIVTYKLPKCNDNEIDA